MKETASRRGNIYLNKGKIVLHLRSLIWIGLAIAVLILSKVLPDSFFEHWYYNRIFRWIRLAYDNLLGWSPIPMIYIVVAIVIIRIIHWFTQMRRGSFY